MFGLVPASEIEKWWDPRILTKTQEYCIYVHLTLHTTPITCVLPIVVALSQKPEKKSAFRQKQLQPTDVAGAGRSATEDSSIVCVQASVSARK